MITASVSFHARKRILLCRCTVSTKHETAKFPLLLRWRPFLSLACPRRNRSLAAQVFNAGASRALNNSPGGKRNRNLFRGAKHNNSNADADANAKAGADILRTDNNPETKTCTVTDRWMELVEKQILQYDEAQLKVAKQLSKLSLALQDYNHETWLEQLNEFEIQQLQEKARDKEEKKRMQGDSKEVVEDNNNQTILKPTVSSISSSSSTATSLRTSVKIPRGLYLYGPVGTGKSMLVDFLYQSLSADNNRSCKVKCQRVHWHSFLLEIHARLRALREHDTEVRRIEKRLANDGENTDLEGNKSAISNEKLTNPKKKRDSLLLDPSDATPLARVATDLASQCTLLIIDEFHVNDIANAMLVYQLLQTLFQRGTVVVMTSNSHPNDLYKGGLNREVAFGPFVDNVLKRYCRVLSMEGKVDYRMQMGSTWGGEKVDANNKMESRKNDFFLSGKRRDGLQHVVDILFGRNAIDGGNVSELTIVEAEVLNVAFGRTLLLPRVAKYQQDLPQGHAQTNRKTPKKPYFVCHSTFDQLCRINAATSSSCPKFLGAADYRALAQACHILILEDVPKFSISVDTPSGRDLDEARRFVTLVDELYEARCLLVCQVLQKENTFNSLVDDDGSDDCDDTLHPLDLFSLDSTSLDVGQEPLISSLGDGAMNASVQELPLALARATSRLVELTAWSTWEKRACVEEEEGDGRLRQFLCTFDEDFTFR